MTSSDDFDDILNGLSNADLQSLSNELDSEQAFDINKQIKHMEKLSIESIEGDNYLPLHGRNYQPRRKDQPAPKEEEIQLPDEWKDAMSQATDKDIEELAGMLGVHSVLTQEQSNSNENTQLKKSLRELNEKKDERFEPSTGVSDYYGKIDQVDVSGLFRRLKDFDETLTEISINNMKDLDDVLMAIADFIARMDCLKKISMANTRMSNRVGEKLAEALQHNKSLAYLNIESNLLSGDVLVKILDAVKDNPCLKELKFANQSKTAGAKNEREMVKKLEENHHLLKFGHAFLTPGLGNMASKWILRNNDKARQKRKSAASK